MTPKERSYWKRRIYNILWNLSHPESVKKYHKKSDIKHREHRREKDRRYRKNNPDIVEARNKASYQKNSWKYNARHYFNDAGIKASDIPPELLQAKIEYLKTLKLCTRTNKATSYTRNLRK